MASYGRLAARALSLEYIYRGGHRALLEERHSLCQLNMIGDCHRAHVTSNSVRSPALACVLSEHPSNDRQ
jgi:hypothetical protein